MTYFDKLSENFISPNALLIIRKFTKHELNTCTASRDIKIFRWRGGGGGGRGGGRSKGGVKTPGGIRLMLNIEKL